MPPRELYYHPGSRAWNSPAIPWTLGTLIVKCLPSDAREVLPYPDTFLPVG